MSRSITAVLLAGLAMVVGWMWPGYGGRSRAVQAKALPTAAFQPAYGKDGSLRVPEDYRRWIFLSSGIDMVYGRAMAMDHSMFDNVFVNPEAYASFLQTGTWPDKTMLILEFRGAETNASINRGGHSQGGPAMGLEVHVKDEKRFPGQWAFFDVSGWTGKLLPQTEDCYSCHAAHAAVDTTFVQFYPTLLPLAKQKHRLSAAYLKESGAAGK